MKSCPLKYKLLPIVGFLLILLIRFWQLISERPAAWVSSKFPGPFLSSLRWPRELNALQLQKTHANKKSTSKSRKYFHQFDRWCKCSQHNQIHLICSVFLFWLCCEHLQRVRCKIEEVVSLICRCFLYLQRVELSRPPYFFLSNHPTYWHRPNSGFHANHANVWNANSLYWMCALLIFLLVLNLHVNKTLYLK